MTWVLSRLLARLESEWCGRRQEAYAHDLSFTGAARRFPDRNELYGYMHHYFANLCPKPVRRHRQYYCKNNRGFGEHAFHAMWWLLLREFRPGRCLEIGVYRGQVISLWGLIGTTLHFPCEVHGISPFSATGDAVSAYDEDIPYRDDTLASFRAFDLEAPTLIVADSKDARASRHISSLAWDLIYVDGNHDYDTALSDFKLSRDNLRSGGLLVMDDASLGTSFRPPRFAFAGHPGPSRVVREEANSQLEHLGWVGHNNVFRKI